MRTTLNVFAAKLRDFAHSRRGNVAMMFAIAMVPMVIAAGAGLDFARAMLVRQQMTGALDAAALAVGSTTGLDQAAAQALAQKFFDANYTVDKTAFGTPTVTIPNSGYNSNGSVQITASTPMPTILMKLAGITTMPVTTSTTVVWGQSKLWVALVFDNSGSMCQPDSQPCVNNSNTASKIYQEKDAAKTMLTSLKGVSTVSGDIMVSIVPFNREVSIGTASPSASYLDWTFWEAVPKANNTTTVTDTYAVPNVHKTTGSSPNTITFSAWGPGDNCPFTTSSNGQMSPFGFYCMPDPTNASTSNKVSSIPNSGTYKGYICPSLDNGNYNTERNDRYYNGCWTSTKNGTNKVIVDQGSSSASCNGFSGTNCSCSGSNGSRVCRTQAWTHTWVPNNHSTWGGCITDRVQDLDIQNGSVSASFPPDNPVSSPTIPVSSTQCMPGIVTPLKPNFTTAENTYLNGQIDAMQAGGSTNQAIGVAHGWMTLTNSAPYSPGAVPANTTRYIILLSDGLNTQNRWVGDGSTEGTPDDALIDGRLSSVCSAAKSDGVIIYTLYVHVNGGGNSAPLQDCASDSSKYYDLTSASQIATAFADITKQITNVRVSR
ncbi:MAG: TadE/TadG family type IV pilus assembly protein [Alphaproteobacteria bacterium]